MCLEVRLPPGQEGTDRQAQLSTLQTQLAAVSKKDFRLPYVRNSFVIQWLRQLNRLATETPLGSQDGG